MTFCVTELEMFATSEFDWLLYRTKEGDFYFYNVHTEQCQWERPKFYSNRVAVNDSQAWRCFKVDNENNDFPDDFFYENIFTKEKTWYVYEECEQLIPFNDPDSWIAFKNSEEIVFFYNIQTKEKTWKKPSWIKEDLSNVKVQLSYHVLKKDKDKYFNYYENLKPDQIQQIETDYLTLLSEISKLRHFSNFERFYEEFHDDKRCQRVTPERRALLFSKYCCNLKSNELKINFDDLTLIEKVKFCRFELKNKQKEVNQFIKSKPSFVLDDFLVFCKNQNLNNLLEILLNLKGNNKFLEKAIKPLRLKVVE